MIRNAYLADQIMNDVLDARGERENEEENASATRNCEATGSQNSSSTNGDDRAALALLSLNGEASNRIMVNGQLKMVLEVVSGENGEWIASSNGHADQNESQSPNGQENEHLLNCESIGDQPLNRSDQNEPLTTKKKRTSGAWAAKQTKKKHFRYQDFYKSLPPLNQLPDRETERMNFRDELNKLIDAVDPGTKHPMTWEGIAVTICHRYPELWESNFSGCVSFIFTFLFGLFQLSNFCFLFFQANLKKLLVNRGKNIRSGATKRRAK